MDDILLHEIQEILQKQREDKYWDFKEFYHINNADLLHDILCMANNSDLFKPSYIIFGVNDQGEIRGVRKDDPNRRNQQQLVDFLKNKEFAEGKRPDVVMRNSLSINKKNIDVLIINNSLDTPYYLIKEFSHQSLDHNNKATWKQRTVRPYHIYTRIHDTNVDIDKQADPHIVENLWKKRFGLLLPPIEMFKKILKNKSEWVSVDLIYHNIYHPGYTVELEYESKNDAEFNKNSNRPKLIPSGTLKLRFFGTPLYSRGFSGDLETGIRFFPESGYILFEKNLKSARYIYFIDGSFEVLLDNFFNENHNRQILFNSPNNKYNSRILIFNSKEEEAKFNLYIRNKFDRFIELGGEITPPLKIIPHETDEALQLLLQDFRNYKLTV